MALAQGAASVGIPIDVVRKAMEGMADHYGEDLANKLIGRLQRPESMTTSVFGPPPPPPGAGGVSVGTSSDMGPTTADVNMGAEVPMRSAMVGAKAPGTYSVQVGTNPLGSRSVMVGTDTQMRDAGTEPDDVEMLAGGGRPPPAPPGLGQRVRPGYSSSNTFFDVPTEIAMPPPTPPPDGPRVPIYTGPTRRPPPAAPLV